jgi:hypothetical protein
MPSMPEEQRRRIYAGWPSTPYPYAISLAFIIFAFWFVFRYQGSLQTTEDELQSSQWLLEL